MLHWSVVAIWWIGRVNHSIRKAYITDDQPLTTDLVLSICYVHFLFHFQILVSNPKTFCNFLRLFLCWSYFISQQNFCSWHSISLSLSLVFLSEWWDSNGHSWWESYSTFNFRRQFSFPKSLLVFSLVMRAQLAWLAIWNKASSVRGNNYKVINWIQSK